MVEIKVKIGEWKLIYKNKEIKDEIIYHHSDLYTPKIEFKNLRNKLSLIFPKSLNEILESFDLFVIHSGGFVEQNIYCDLYSFENLWKEFQKKRVFKVGNHVFKFVIVTRDLDEVIDEIMAELI